MTEIIEKLVSTIIPVYNRPEMLKDAVESVLAQTYRPIEIIISDDGSVDETPLVAQALVRAYAKKIRVIRNQNQGPGPAREAGRQLARGEFIQYLDSDDLLRPFKFEMQIKALHDHPECGAAYGYICLHIGDGPPKKEPYKWSERTLPTLFPWLLVDRWWNTDAPLFRRSVCDAVGPWSNLRWSQDWEYDGKVGALGTRLFHCKEFVCDQRQHDGSRQTSWANWLEPVRAKERKRFLGMMLEHAKKAGITPEYPEMQHFSRWLFLTARQCGAAGLTEDSQQCFEWAKEAAGSGRQKGREFKVYKAMTGVLGWTLTGKLFCRLDKLIKHKPGPSTMKQSWMGE